MKLSARALLALAPFLPLLLACDQAPSRPAVIAECGPEGRGVCVFPEDFEMACGEALHRCPAGTRRVCALDGITDEELLALPVCRERSLPCSPCPPCWPSDPVAPGGAPAAMVPEYEDPQR